MLALDRLALPAGAPGRSLYRFDAAVTAIFAIGASLAVAYPGVFRVPFAVLCCGCFAIGTLAFLIAYGRAVARSRQEQIAITGIYGLSRSCPRGVQWRFHALTSVQVVVAVVTASMRPFTAQAFGILVPMLGLGLGGVWAARHGVFGERDDPRTRARRQVKESFDD